jgi:hypothetical protein
MNKRHKRHVELLESGKDAPLFGHIQYGVQSIEIAEAGLTPGNSPTLITSAAGPFFSYHATCEIKFLLKHMLI